MSSLPFQSHVRTIDDLRGPAGRLEALFNGGLPDAPLAAVVAHPHPLFGGTMHNKVVYHAMKALNGFGIPVLRFNFRGVGLSEGVHDEARGELDDVRAALDYLETLPATGGRPLLCAGFSFGAYVALRAGCGRAGIAGQIGLGLPVKAAGRNYTYEFLSGCTAPKLFVSGDDDAFCPAEALARALAIAPEPKRTVIVAGADHFFQGTPASPAAKLEGLQAALRDWVESTFALRVATGEQT